MDKGLHILRETHMYQTVPESRHNGLVHITVSYRVTGPYNISPTDQDSAM